MSTHRVDEQTERLIVRLLDGATTAEEAAELRSLLLRDPAARTLHDEYSGIDASAKAALTQVLVKPRAAVTVSRSRRGLWLAAAAGVMAAAAVLGLTVFPYRPAAAPRIGFTELARAPGVRAAPPAQSGVPGQPEPRFVADEPLSGPQAWRQIVPHRNMINVHRDWLGVLDPETEQIYLLGVDRRNIRRMPVWYEH